MILLACGVTITDDHTRLARLETNDAAPLLTAALGTAAGVDLVVHHAFALPSAMITPDDNTDTIPKWLCM
jgi:hypothetical protein